MARQKQEQPSEKPILTESAFISELKRVIENFVKDEADISTAMKGREAKIKELQQEQGEDASNLIRVRGALSALAHMKNFCKTAENTKVENT